MVNGVNIQYIYIPESSIHLGQGEIFLKVSLLDYNIPLIGI